MRLIDADKLKQRLPTFSSVIDEMPTIDVEPVKHGYWIKTPSPYHVKCSSCKTMICIKFHGIEVEKFCRHCGAKMDLKDGETK